MKFEKISFTERLPTLTGLVTSIRARPPWFFRFLALPQEVWNPCHGFLSLKPGILTSPAMKPPIWQVWLWAGHPETMDPSFEAMHKDYRKSSIGN